MRIPEAPFSSAPPMGNNQRTPAGDSNRRWLKRVLIGAGILAGIVVLTLGGLIVAGLGTIIFGVESRERAYFDPPPGMKVVIKEVEKVPDNLKPYFVPFTFHCPEKLKFVSRPDAFLASEDNTNGTATGIICVLPILPVATSADWESVFAERMKEISGVYATKYKNYQELSQGPEGIPNHSDCWQMRWQAEELDQSGEARVIYGRELLVRHEKRSRALQVSLRASGDPEVQGARDVGDKGVLASVVKTFRIQAPAHKRVKGTSPRR